MHPHFRGGSKLFESYTANSNTWCPRLTAAIILSGSAVQGKSFGSSLVSRRKRLIAAWLLLLPCPAIIFLSLSIAFDIFNQLAHVIVATIFEIHQVRMREVCNIG